MRDILSSCSLRTFCHLNGLSTVWSRLLSAYVSLIKANMCQDQCRWRRQASHIYIYMYVSDRYPITKIRITNANICLSYCKLIYAIFHTYDLFLGLIAFSKTDKLHLIHFHFDKNYACFACDLKRDMRVSIVHQKWH